MRTTININDAILRELRERARDSGRAFREVVEQSLEIGLAYLNDSPKRKKFRVRPHRLELKPGYRGMSMNQLYDQIEAEESTRET